MIKFAVLYRLYWLLLGSQSSWTLTSANISWSFASPERYYFIILSNKQHKCCPIIITTLQSEWPDGYIICSTFGHLHHKNLLTDQLPVYVGSKLCPIQIKNSLKIAQLFKNSLSCEISQYLVTLPTLSIGHCMVIMSQCDKLECHVIVSLKHFILRQFSVCCPINFSQDANDRKMSRTKTDYFRVTKDS